VYDTELLLAGNYGLSDGAPSEDSLDGGSSSVMISSSPVSAVKSINDRRSDGQENLSADGVEITAQNAQSFLLPQACVFVAK
jgi:hypothetical protein